MGIHSINGTRFLVGKYFYIMKVIYINIILDCVHESKRCTTTFKYGEM